MIVTTTSLLKELNPVNSEISVAIPLNFSHYQSGIVKFEPRRANEDKWITHENAEVVSYVLKGKGRFRLQKKDHHVTPGTICHVPVNTSHDFVADGEPLVMFYINITVKPDNIV